MNLTLSPLPVIGSAEFPRETQAIFNQIQDLQKQALAQVGSTYENRVELNRHLVSLGVELFSAMQIALQTDALEALPDDEVFDDKGIIEFGKILYEFADILKMAAKKIGAIALISQGRTVDRSISSTEQARRISDELGF